MVRVYTGRVVALVANIHPFWNRPIDLLPNKPMRVDNLAINPKPPMPKRVPSPNPNPAPIRFLDFLPKPLLSRFHFSLPV